MMMKKIVAVVVVLLSLGVFSCGKQDASAAGTVESPVSVQAMLANASKYKLTVVELGSVRCRPCQMMTPVLESVAGAYKGKVRVVFFDVWQDQTPARHYAIRVIPVQIFLDSTGKEVFRHEGFYPEGELRKKIGELLK